MAGEADTRARILEAARDRLLEGGLPGVSMRKIARDVGVSATAIYRHFDRKEELVVAVIEEGFRRFAAYLWRSLDAAKPLDRLREAGVQYVRFALENDRYYRVMFMTPCDELGYDQVTERTSEGLAPTFQFLVDRVRECIDAGALSHEDPTSLSATIWAHVHGHVALYLFDHLTGTLGDRDAFVSFYRDSQRRLLDGLVSRHR